MAHEYRTHRRVEFAETDMAGILHFANFFRYMEEAEHAFFRSLGLHVHAETEAGVRGFARGRAECTYLAPLRYEDVVEIQVLVRAKRARSIDYDFVFRKAEADDAPAEVARGALTVVCVGKAPGEGRLRAVPLPPEVDAAIEPAPPNLLGD